MNTVLDFGLLALVGAIWFVTIMAYGACMAAARADRITQQNFFPMQPMQPSRRREARENKTRISTWYTRSSRID